MWVPHFGATAWRSALIGASLKCEDCTSFGNDLINGELKHQTWYLTKNKKNSDMVPQKKKNQNWSLQYSQGGLAIVEPHLAWHHAGRQGIPLPCERKCRDNFGLLSEQWDPLLSKFGRQLREGAWNSKQNGCPSRYH